MQGISTITQKGQVAIPKAIRDHFNLNPFDKLRFTIEKDKIIAEPVPSIQAMLGIVKAKRTIPKQGQKLAIQEQVIKKYESRT